MTGVELKPPHKYQFAFRLASGFVIQAEYIQLPAHMINEQGQLMVPDWIEKPKRNELGGVTRLGGNVKQGYETAASEWLGVR